MRWLNGITNLMDINLSKLWGLVINRQAWQAAVYRVTKSQTQLIDRTELRFQEAVAKEKSKNGLESIRPEMVADFTSSRPCVSFKNHCNTLAK